MVLYPIRYTKEGRRRGEFPIGSLEFSDAGVVVDVPDKRLRAQVEELFAQAFQVRVSWGSPETVLAHGWKEVPPGSLEHFQEGIRRLRNLDILASAEES